MNEISLSEREQECLQHLRQAEVLGTSWENPYAIQHFGESSELLSGRLVVSSLTGSNSC